MCCRVFYSRCTLCMFNAWQMLHDLAGFSSGSKIVRENLKSKSWSMIRRTSRRFHEKKHMSIVKCEIGAQAINNSQLSLPQIYFLIVKIFKVDVTFLTIFKVSRDELSEIYIQGITWRVYLISHFLKINYSIRQKQQNLYYFHISIIFI